MNGITQVSSTSSLTLAALALAGDESSAVSPATQSTQVAGLFGISRETNRLAAEYVRSQRDNIDAAARASGISPYAIGAVMFQEARNYDTVDEMFDVKARAFVQADPGSAAATAAGIDLQDAAVGLSQDGTIDTVSFGPAQIQLRNVRALIEQGYLPKPAGYDTDPTRATLALALDPSQAPYVVAAHLRRVSDDWVARGGTTDIRSNPEAQYKLLTQLYSQYSPGESRANPNPDLRTSRLNESGQDAVANFSVIRKALYTDSPIHGFEGQRLPAEQRYDRNDPLQGLPGRRLSSVDLPEDLGVSGRAAPTPQLATLMNLPTVLFAN